MEQCPICFNELEVRDCAPCDACGGAPDEREHFDERQYITYEIFEGLRLTLCDFCTVDFGSFKPEFFGLKNEKRLSLSDFTFVEQIEYPEITKDKYCPECSARLRFLKFVAEVRRINEAG